MPFLVQLTRDAAPLIRSIACWTLSRFGQWSLEAGSPADQDAFFRPILQALVLRVLDRNKKVQEAACSAVSSLSEIAQARMSPYLVDLVSAIVQAFNIYQAKNMLLLYDMLGAMSEAVGDALNQPQLVAGFMPPLMQRFRTISDDDRNLWPVFECMGLVASSLRVGFLPYAQEVFARCTMVISHFFQNEAVCPRLSMLISDFFRSLIAFFFQSGGFGQF
jgi:transportin-1